MNQKESPPRHSGGLSVLGRFCQAFPGRLSPLTQPGGLTCPHALPASRPVPPLQPGGGSRSSSLQAVVDDPRERSQISLGLFELTCPNLQQFGGAESLPTIETQPPPIHARRPDPRGKHGGFSASARGAVHHGRSPSREKRAGFVGTVGSASPVARRLFGFQNPVQHAPAGVAVAFTDALRVGHLGKR